MKYFAQFYTMSSGFAFIDGKFKEVPKEIIEAISSDGYCHIDGRLSYSNKLCAAKAYYATLRKLNKGYVGFVIMQTYSGRLSDGKQVGGYHKL